MRPCCKISCIFNIVDKTVQEYVTFEYEILENIAILFMYINKYINNVIVNLTLGNILTIGQMKKLTHLL